MRTSKCLPYTQTDEQTDRQTEATTTPEGQNWPRVKIDQTFKQGKSEGCDSYDRPSNLTQIGFKSSTNQSV